MLFPVYLHRVGVHNVAHISHALAHAAMQQVDLISDLPFELKLCCYVQLSSICDVHALSATSRLWRHIYVTREVEILHGFAENILLEDLPSLHLPNQALQARLFDWTTQNTTESPPEFRSQHWNEGRQPLREAEFEAKVAQFAATYTPETFQSGLSDNLDLRLIRHAIKTHHVMQYLVQDFISTAFAQHPATEGVEIVSPAYAQQLAVEWVRNPNTTDAMPISKAERHRLFTAFYRWYLWIEICGNPEGIRPSQDWPPENDLRRQEVEIWFGLSSVIFDSDTKVWDVEALACLAVYAWQKYEQARDLVIACSEDQKFGERPASDYQELVIACKESTWNTLCMLYRSARLCIVLTVSGYYHIGASHGPLRLCSLLRSKGTLDGMLAENIEKWFDCELVYEGHDKFFAMLRDVWDKVRDDLTQAPESWLWAHEWEYQRGDTVDVGGSTDYENI